MDSRKDDKLRRAADKVVAPLEALIKQMASIDPGLSVSEAEIRETDSGMKLAYRARPVSIAFVNSSRKIIVRVEPAEESKPLD